MIVVSYVYGNDLISQNRGGARSFYHVDGLGSTRALTNASGVVTDRYIYDAFGRTIGQVGSTGNVYLFAGEQRDANVGLDYLRARYLSVGTGRFYGTDPFEGVLEIPSTLPDYYYAGANPVNKVDPSGEFLAAAIAVVAILPIVALLGAQPVFAAPLTRPREVVVTVTMTVTGYAVTFPWHDKHRNNRSVWYQVLNL